MILQDNNILIFKIFDIRPCHWVVIVFAVVQVIIRDVVFPLLCHSSEDDQLWNSDPVEYIRTKYGLTYSSTVQ